MFKDAKVNDRVFTYAQGWGTIIDTDNNDVYPIKVKFDNDGSISFTLEGYLYSRDINPTLFWDEIKFDIPSKPLPKLEVDTKVIVWENNGPKKKRHFSHFNK